MPPRQVLAQLREVAAMNPLLKLAIARNLLRKYRQLSYQWRSNRQVRHDGFDRRHGTETTRIVQTRDRLGCPVNWYETASETAILAAIDGLDLERNGFNVKRTSFVDLGCGKGKPLLVASRYPFARIVGVDIDAGCLEIAHKNTAICGLEERIELMMADAIAYDLPAGPLLLYLYNPFPGWVLQRVIDKLAKRLKHSTDPIAITYLNPCSLDIIERSGLFRKVSETEGHSSSYERSVGFISMGNLDRSSSTE